MCVREDRHYEEGECFNCSEGNAVLGTGCTAINVRWKGMEEGIDPQNS